MDNALLIVRYRFLSGSRWLRDHAFVSFVLAPMIVVGSLFVLWDAISVGIEGLAGWVAHGSARSGTIAVLAILPVPASCLVRRYRTHWGLGRVTLL